MTRHNPSIAIFLPSFAGGGAERSMLTLAQGFADRGLHVALVVARAEGPYRDLVDPRVTLIDLRVRRVAHGLPGLVRYLRRERPAALLATLDYANVIAIIARRLAQVPTRVAVVEQNTISITARQSRQWRQRMMPRLVRRCYRWADQVIGNSQGVADDLRGIIGPSNANLQVIYNPVVTPQLLARAGVDCPHEWFGPGQPPVVLAIGRLMPQKDFPTLIQAFARVRQRCPTRLMILGEGPAREPLEALGRDLGLNGDLLLPGFVGNPYAFLARASLFVLSSRWEGLPTVLIEALACGTPVVATDCPSGPREILAGGRYGPLVPVQDVDALAAAMTSALSDGREAPPAESWRPYELGAVVDQYLEVLFGYQSRSALPA